MHMWIYRVCGWHNLQDNIEDELECIVDLRVSVTEIKSLRKENRQLLLGSYGYAHLSH